jgi:hypothetical protein
LGSTTGQPHHCGEGHWQPQSGKLRSLFHGELDGRDARVLPKPPNDSNSATAAGNARSAATIASQFSRTAPLPSGAAVRCSALLGLRGSLRTSDGAYHERHEALSHHEEALSNAPRGRPEWDAEKFYTAEQN